MPIILQEVCPLSWEWTVDGGVLAYEEEGAPMTGCVLYKRTYAHRVREAGTEHSSGQVGE